MKIKNKIILSFKDKSFSGGQDIVISSLDKKESGDYYIAPLTDFSGNSGFHFSSHKSGEAHFKTSNPENIVSLPPKEKLQENLDSVLKDIIKLPEEQTPAHIFIISEKIFDKVVGLTIEGKKIKICIDNIYLSRNWKRMDITDTTKIKSTLKDFEEKGKLDVNDMLYITTSNFISFFKRLEKFDDFNIQMPQECIDFIKELGGIVFTIPFKLNNKSEAEKNPLSKLFEPNVDKMIQLVLTVFIPKTEQNEKLLS